jgi:hypothetical protein
VATYPRPFYAIECVDEDEAQALLELSPPGSHVEVAAKGAGFLVILWVPVPDDVLRFELD